MNNWVKDMEFRTDITNKLMETVKRRRTALILTHNNPDPDSIAAAMALKHILFKTKRIQSIIGYGGIIGRAENRAMMNNLKIDMTPVSDVTFTKDKMIALIDSQPGAGNNPLPKKVKADIVIDHHAPLRVRTREAEFYDVRVKYGSTSTILTEYMMALNLPFNKRIATSLYYGIKSDIDNLARDRVPADFEGLQLLFPHVSISLLTKIEHSKVPKEYFQKFATGINNAVVFRDVVVSDLKDAANSDIVSEMADFLIRMERIRWSLCFGTIGNQLILSIRTSSRSKWASNIATALLRRRGTGGGHHRSAAGKIDIADLSMEEIDHLKDSITKRFLKLVGREGSHAMRLLKNEV
ncbi:MAG: DHH family phosphoesterase [Pseudomonadota bacterium]